MRFVLAIVLFVVAAGAISLGIAQRTILQGPDTLSAQVATEEAPLTVIDGETLNAHAGTQALEVQGEGPIVLAYGKTADVLGWVGDAPHNVIGYDAETGELTTEFVRGSEEEIPTPEGSDLWLREYTGTDSLARTINAPEDISVLIAADGTAPAPSDVSITWPVDNSAPLSGPLVVGGVVVLLLGLLALLWALIHARRRRGPRRSQPKMPKPPKPPQLKRGSRGTPGDQPELEPGSTARRGRGRRALTMTVAGFSALAVLAGCAPTDAEPTPTATPTELLQANPVAVTEQQLEGIVAELAQTVADADAASDGNIAAGRLGGAALELRNASYAIRKADAAIPALPAIPDNLEIALPRQTDEWPRSVFAVVTAEDGSSPTALLLRQETPRENYKAIYVVTLESTVPDVAPAELGAPQLAVDNQLGIMQPNALASAYGDILINGDASPFAEVFDPEGDELRAELGAQYKADRKASLPASATIEYSNGPSDDPIIAFGTVESGQIVAVGLDDVEVVKPTEAGAAINPSGAVKALLGKGQSTKGVQATYGMQLLFYVPPVTEEGEKIRLLGFTQGLVAAVELP